jgi:hypothetical protein
MNNLLFQFGLPDIAMPMAHIEEAEFATLVANERDDAAVEGNTQFPLKPRPLPDSSKDKSNRPLIHLDTYEEFEQEVKSAYATALGHHKSGSVADAIAHYERALAYRYMGTIAVPSNAVAASPHEVPNINLLRKSNDDQLSSMGLGSIHINLGVAHLAQFHFTQAVEEYCTTLLLSNFTNSKAKFNLAIAFSKMSTTFLRTAETEFLAHKKVAKEKQDRMGLGALTMREAISFRLLLASRFWFVESLHTPISNAQNARTFQQKCIGGLYETGKIFRRLHLKTTQNTQNVLAWDIQVVFEYLNLIYDACKTIQKSGADGVAEFAPHAATALRRKREVLVPMLDEIKWEGLQLNANLTPRFNGLLNECIALKNALAAEVDAVKEEVVEKSAGTEPQPALSPPAPPSVKLADGQKVANAVTCQSSEKTVNNGDSVASGDGSPSLFDDASSVDSTDSNLASHFCVEDGNIGDASQVPQQEAAPRPSTPNRERSQWLQSLFKEVGLHCCVRVISNLTHSQLMSMAETTGPTINCAASHNRIVVGSIRLHAGGVPLFSRNARIDGTLQNGFHTLVAIDMQILEDHMTAIDHASFSWRLRVSLLSVEPVTQLFRKHTENFFLSPKYLQSLGPSTQQQTSAAQEIIDCIMVNEEPDDILRPKQKVESKSKSPHGPSLVKFRRLSLQIKSEHNQNDALLTLSEKETQRCLLRIFSDDNFGLMQCNFDSASQRDNSGNQRLKMSQRAIHTLQLKLRQKDNELIPFTFHTCRVFLAISEPLYDPHTDDLYWKVTVSMDLGQLTQPENSRQNTNGDAADGFIQTSAFMSSISVGLFQLTLEVGVQNDNGDSIAPILSLGYSS